MKNLSREFATMSDEERQRKEPAPWPMTSERPRRSVRSPMPESTSAAGSAGSPAWPAPP